MKVSFSCVTDIPKLSGLNNNDLFSSQFCALTVWAWLSWVVLLLAWLGLWSVGGDHMVTHSGLPWAFSCGRGRVPRQQKQKLQGLLRPRLETGTTALPLHSISPCKSWGQSQFKGSRNRSHLLIGRVIKCANLPHG